MADPKLVARANEVIDRLFALNEAMESADAFCAYLKELTRVTSCEAILGEAIRRRSCPRLVDPLGSRRNSPGGGWNDHGMS